MKNYFSDISVVLIAVAVGLGAGYWYGNLTGYNRGVESQQKVVANNAARTINPFSNTDTNPFDETTANPYSNIKTNPFE